jgi:hypothetical protein
LRDHINVNGKLLQTNKRFSQLKKSQKEWIATELRTLYHNQMSESGTTKKLSPDNFNTVISSLYEQIQNREIWIPHGELKKYANGKITKIVNSFKKDSGWFSEEIKD